MSSVHCISVRNECRPCAVHEGHMETQTQGEIPGMSGMKQTNFHLIFISSFVKYEH